MRSAASLSRTAKRVLVIGSGGISHEPPVPEIAGANAEVTERLIAGRNPSAESREARQARTVAAAKSFTAGDSPLHPLNPEWDRAFLDLLAAGDITAVDGMTNSAITRDGGKSAHEIRTWIAAFGALAAYGLLSGLARLLPAYPRMDRGLRRDACTTRDRKGTGGDFHVR